MGERGAWPASGSAAARDASSHAPLAPLRFACASPRDDHVADGGGFYGGGGFDQDGGGFYGGEGGQQASLPSAGASQGSGGAKRANRSVVPVTIKQILTAKQAHPDGEYTIDGHEVSQVRRAHLAGRSTR